MNFLNSILDFIMSHKATLALSLLLIGRAYYSIIHGGGIVGLWKGIMFGTNTPKKPTLTK